MEMSETVQHLVESAKIYQMVTERLDLIQSHTFESELIEWILDIYSQDEPPVEGLQKFSMPQVMYYLQASHKLYLSKTLPEIEQSMAHIQKRHDDTLLHALILFFNHYKIDFLEHIRMEERDLFPYLKKLHEIDPQSTSKEEIATLLSQSPMEKFEHDAIEDELKRVSDIIHHYCGDEEVPLPFKVFLNQVEIFEMDLRKHAFIEDHVLMPMAQRKEAELKALI